MLPTYVLHWFLNMTTGNLISGHDFNVAENWKKGGNAFTIVNSRSGNTFCEWNGLRAGNLVGRRRQKRVLKLCLQNQHMVVFE